MERAHALAAIVVIMLAAAFVQVGGAADVQQTAQQNSTITKPAAGEIDRLLSESPDDPDANRIRQLAAEALNLETQGRSNEARAKWEEVNALLDSLVVRLQKRNADRTMFFVSAVLVAVVLSALAIYVSGRKAKSAAKQDEKAAGARINELEAERAQLMKKFMKREIDYAAYLKLIGGIDKEAIELQAKLSSSK